MSASATSQQGSRPGQKRGRQVEPEALLQIRELLGDGARDRDLLIEYLHRIQDHYHAIRPRHVAALAAELKLAEVEVYEVASFYHHFNLVRGDEPVPSLTLRICDSISCQLAGAETLIAAMQQQLDADVQIVRAPCLGRCAKAPVALLGNMPVDQADADSIRSVITAESRDAASPATYLGLNDYLAQGGYELLYACRNGQRSVDRVIEQVEASGLRGLGGAGFPAGRKWRILREQAGERLLVVNIDEGEPGTFKDRYYLERDPHRMLEGALIAAWAIDAGAIYLYLRDEYAGIHALLHRELQQLRQHDPSLPPIYLRRGAGSYVCGEESALIESLEGKRGMPRLRPPYIAQNGLFGKPTLAHNMETLFWIRDILEKGPEWLSNNGRHGRSGMRSFSVSGRVAKPGVVRAPAGITLHELVEEYCGGMQPGHELYGYFPGGASGGILPASLADIPLDFDTLQAHGCFIGSAAIIVFSTADSARDLALNAMRFFAAESCGQCTPCRVGTARAVELMQREVWDQVLLTDLAEVMADASICGLGQAAPNPMLCAMRYFPAEFG